jgi:hypothetical protein
MDRISFMTKHSRWGKRTSPDGQMGRKLPHSVLARLGRWGIPVSPLVPGATRGLILAGP